MTTIKRMCKSVCKLSSIKKIVMTALILAGGIFQFSSNGSSAAANASIEPCEASICPKKCKFPPALRAEGGESNGRTLNRSV